MTPSAILPLPLFKCLLHVDACLSFLNNETINQNIKGRVTSLVAYTNSTKYDLSVFTPWTTIPDEWDRSDKNEILHKCANYVHNPKKDQV